MQLWARHVTARRTLVACSALPEIITGYRSAAAHELLLQVPCGSPGEDSGPVSPKIPCRLKRGKVVSASAFALGGHRHCAILRQSKHFWDPHSPEQAMAVTRTQMLGSAQLMGWNTASTRVRLHATRAFHRGMDKVVSHQFKQKGTASIDLCVLLVDQRLGGCHKHHPPPMLHDVVADVV